MNASIIQEFKIIGVGTIGIKAEAGKTIGNVPLFLSQRTDATIIDWSISVENTFETMVTPTFYANEFASLFMRFRLNAIRTKATWNEPKISFHHALGFGSFKGKEQHNIDFQSMDNGYFETGLILDGILSSRSIGLRLGVFYNYGFYAAPDWKMNIVPRFAMSINL